MYHVEDLDIAVVGAGHAGIEAALAAARLGCRVGLFTIQLDAVGNMPCNPSIGGTAKGHLVREIDALGGEMGRAADATTIQSRMLNRGKGPAVHSLRAQIDRTKYRLHMKQVLEKCENLQLIQAEIVDLLTEDGNISAVVTQYGGFYNVKAVVLATGTYLGGRIIVGDTAYDGGPDGMFAARPLVDCLRRLELPIRRFKTGTPARVNRRSIDFSKMEIQYGDEPTVPFSFETEIPPENKTVCHLTYTNEKTHQIIQQNIHLSPLFSGMIQGVGPRYCPSIEDKIHRFADKERHQLFIEPCGLDTEEMYIQGLSSSLPEFVQRAFLHTIAGLENAQIMRLAYAIEYDCVDPTALTSALAFKSIPNLFGAGQFNGSSGYEEAAAQGLIAGINAARMIQGLAPFTLDRSTSYIGTLIDDLVTKGTPEPYRMMTSRSEYRLLLRQDNADLRLTPMGHQIGLISDERYQAFLEKKEQIETEIHRLETTVISPKNPCIQQLLTDNGMPALVTGQTLAALLCRPQLTYAALAVVDTHRPSLSPAVCEQVEISLKYKGYIEKQQAEVASFLKLERRRLPEDICYQQLAGLRLEARQKLEQHRPQTVGKASRISGVSPADISVLLLYLEQRGRENAL